MKIAFCGDLSLREIDKYSEDPFDNIRELLADARPVINLEAPFLKRDLQPIKNKISLFQYNKQITHIRSLNPFLLNLGNNHINDFGNEGAQNTMFLLKENEISFFGAGLINEEHNIFICEDCKTVFFSYVMPTVDQTSFSLFNTEDLCGPKEYSSELFRKQSANYQNYIKVVLFHWGLEFYKLPLPEQRQLAREIVDLGADLLIGTHPHVLQGYEQYQEKYIFYSLGDFLITPQKIFLNGKTYYAVPGQASKESLMPVFDFRQGRMELVEIFNLRINRRFELSFASKKNLIVNKFLLPDLRKYKIMYSFYALFNRLFLKFSFPWRFIKKRLFFIFHN